MIRLIVFAVIGLVVGLGGGSGVAVMRAKKVVAAAHDSTAKADSAGRKKSGEDVKPTGEEGAEHSAVASQAPDSTAAVAQAPLPKHDSATVAPTATPHVPAIAPPTPTVAATNDTGHAAAPPVPGRIAKIFAAMSAKDAARVLQQMDDVDVQTVLSGLNDRQAAAILAGFSPERAAAISRATLRGKKGTS